jgi:hypothetical protein
MAQWTVNPYVASSSLARGASFLVFFHGWELFSGLLPVSCSSRTRVRPVAP